MDPDLRRSGSGHRFRALPRLLAGAPWWLSVVLGIALVFAGGFLVARPLTALGVLGVYIGVSCVLSGLSDLLSRAPADGPDLHPRRRRPHLAHIAAWSWVALGVVVLAWVGRDIDLLGPVVALALIVSGVAAILRLLWEYEAERWVAAVFGLSEIAFGILALLWPDATLVVIAILFGGRTALFGLSLAWRGLAPHLHRTGTAEPVRASTANKPTPRRRTRWLAGLRWTAAVLVLVLAATTLLISHRSLEGVPVAGAFYDAPETLPETPGQLVRWEPYEEDLPDGMIGYRMLYVTTDAANEPVPASAVLAVPETTEEPVPLISWAHGTVGVSRGCAPSIGGEAITDKIVPAVDSLARNGWALVATDYPGMGTEGAYPYLVGEGQGRAVLDAARAAQQMPETQIAEPTVIWGHSQGGHAALWAGELADSYAPELDLLGTAALSPASEPEELAETVLAHPDAFGASILISYLMDAYSRYYEDVEFDDVVAASARTIVQEAAARCVTAGGTLVTALTGLAISWDQPIIREQALQGPLRDRLRENRPQGPWDAPLFIGQGESDEVIPYRINQSYVADLCAAGIDVEFQGYPGETHLSILGPSTELSHDLEAWTRARMAGEPASPNCP